ncbi:MAG TPA: hypothetical protein PLP42_14305 [Acidobacteriota bacterium]|nr:hypothetical protein [Acidobacteriota bacterium]
MRNHYLWPVLAAFCLLSMLILLPFRQAEAQDGQDTPRPTVFQAAGTTVTSILCSVDFFRAALGQPNNANTAGPLTSGRREINWDGGGSTETSPAPTPFEGFLEGRGALITTPGTGFVQAPVSGLADTFANPTYTTIFQPFSPLRLFAPVGSNITDVEFFVPGGGNVQALTSGFGVVFSDVDKPDATDPAAQTLIQYYGANDELLFSGFVPASPSDASLSFFGVVYAEPVIRRVRITTGYAALGPNDDAQQDMVVMDDFLYGEPQPLMQ